MASPSRAAYLALCALIVAILLANSATGFETRKLAGDRRPRRARPGSTSQTASLKLTAAAAPTPAPAPVSLSLAPSCGNEDDLCCEGGTCNADGHLVCVTDDVNMLAICITCGNEGAPPCDSAVEGDPPYCNRHLVAVNGVCGEPAVVGEDCCGDGFSCCGDGCILPEDLAITECPLEGTCGCE